LDEPGSHSLFLYIADITIINWEAISGIVALIILLLGSALVSGSEVAFFSLSPTHKKDLEEENSKTAEVILFLLDHTKSLLATILISNNFINVAIILLSSLLSQMLFSFESTTLFGIFISSGMIAFLVNVVAITFLILLTGEVIPKVYASKYPMQLSRTMALPLHTAYKIFDRIKLVTLLVRSTRFIDRRMKKKGNNISVNELSHALEITDTHEIREEDERILKGIVKFGTTDVKQVMTPRLDVVAIDEATPYKELLEEITESGYSRIPVFEENFDNVKGVLYLKDLLPYLNEEESFEWTKLMREPFYVPENKKIDDLLKEFQDKKIHLAIVVDEYGGSSGIITLEDVIEEIVGEISDEFDDEDLVYSRLDDHNYVFEGKTPLNDVYRVLDIEGDIFEESKGEADTLAGFVLELAGKIPQKNERVSFENYTFTVEASDKRRIKRVKLTIEDESMNDDNENQNE
jgi:gliding motility-associated protein GldE